MGGKCCPSGEKCRSGRKISGAKDCPEKCCKFGYCKKEGGVLPCDSCKGCERVIQSLAEPGETVILTKDISISSKTCIGPLVWREYNTGVTFDCQGHKITGTHHLGLGIYVDESDNTIKNCVIKNFVNGMIVEGDNHKIISNTIIDSEIYGILIHTSSGNSEITSNTICYNSGHDIYIMGGSATFSDNTCDTCKDVDCSVACAHSCS